MPRLDHTAEYDNFELTREDAVVTVRIDSTSPMNGVNSTLAKEFRTIGRQLREDDSVRAVVLTGTDDVYCAGADLSALGGDDRDSPRLRRLAATLHEAIGHLLRMRPPLVTAVNGTAAGGGFGLAILGDLVVMSDAARLEFAYPRVGLTGDAGSTFLLPRLVGLRQARELVLTDEPIGPDEAVEMGLATEAVPAAELAARRRELAAELAAGPTHAYGATRQLLLASFERSLDDQLAAETDAIAAAAETDDYQRGYAAFFGDESESPAFEGN